MNKFIYYIAAMLVVASIFSFQYFKIKELRSQVDRWQNKAQETLKELSVCNASLDTQNAAIERFKADSELLQETHKKQVDNLTKQLADRKIEVVEILKTDPSCEKQLQLIYEDQKRFLSND